MKRTKWDFFSYLFFRGMENGAWCCFSDEFVNKSDVGESTSHHNRVVSSPRAIRIKIFWTQSAKKSNIWKL